MLDFSNLEQYRENNRIEAKKALGGLPRSIWETYSAFANTLGGILLLGVVERKDKSLHAIDLPDPEKLVREFWKLVNDREQASANILTADQVQIRKVDGKRIVVITVPRAQRFDRPVYIGGNPLTGTYRRSGEGDYRCTREEVLAMLRDAAVQPQDGRPLERMQPDVLDGDTVRRFRIRMKNERPGHAWEELGDEEFLYKAGAIARGQDGALHPTAAGLLLFGHEYEIVREFPHYFLDYRELPDDAGHWTGRIVSSSGDWSGNLYDFYCRVSQRLAEDAPPAPLVRRALCEALVNCLVNADYCGRQGVVVIRQRDFVSISNPGSFRIEPETVRSGGISDPRNAALFKLFLLVNVGEHTGSGVPRLYAAWREQGWPPPVFTEQFRPDRITVHLPLSGNGDVPPAAAAEKKPSSSRVKKQLIIDFLTEHRSAKASEIAAYLGLKPSRAREYLKELTDENILTAVGANKNRTYELKA